MDDQNIDYTKLGQARDRAVNLRNTLSTKRTNSQKGKYSITIDGNQNVLNCLVNGEEDKDLKEVINDLIIKSQQIAASELVNL
jgi:hypothetical protein